MILDRVECSILCRIHHHCEGVDGPGLKTSAIEKSPGVNQSTEEVSIPNEDDSRTTESRSNAEVLKSIGTAKSRPSP